MVNWAYQRLGTVSTHKWFPSSRRRQLVCICLFFGAFLLLLSAAHPTARKMGHDYYSMSIGNEGSAIPEEGMDPKDTTTSTKTDTPANTAEGTAPINAGEDTNPEVLKTPGPPTYEVLKKWEDNLPQHDLNLPFPEGRTGRYVKFSNEFKNVGWNNCLNERLMNAHLAYMSKRAYVFSEYVWAPVHYLWPASQQPEGGPRTPLNALISGPMAGGLWDVGDDAPRSVSEHFFDIVCPQEERRLIYTPDIKPAVVDLPGDVVFAHWQKLLLEAPERCIEVIPPTPDIDHLPQTFDLYIWGNKRILSLWDLFSKSPISRLLAPSPIVSAAIDRNEYLFLPRGPRPPHPAPRSPYARMLAIHLRRGDYLVHCHNLASWNSTYYGWAQLPSLPDTFTPLPDDDPERIDKMLTHCLPTSAQIVKRIHDVREEYLKAGPRRLLDVLYLLTNDQETWLDGLKAELKTAGWHTIVTTRDLQLDAEQTDVSMAIDMELARMAAVFIGNGWSSFTSDIIHQRLVDGREPITIRLT